MKLFEVFGEITIKDDDAKKKLDKTDSSAKQMGKTFMKTAGIVAGVAASVGLLGSQFIKLANDQEKAETRLTSIAKNVTGATDEQVQSMMNLAAAQQEVTTYGDEVIMAGQSQILSFGVQTESAEKLTQSMTDLLAANNGANATQEDAINAANMLGKALNGQAGALSRAGILVSDSQKEMLELGDETERVAALTQIMEDNYGGLSQELAGTTEGQFIQLKNQLGDIGEQIGETLIPFALEMINVISRMATAWAETFSWLNGVLGETSNMIADVQQEQLSALNETLSEQQSSKQQKIQMINEEKQAFIQAEQDKLMEQAQAISESIALEQERTNKLIKSAAAGAAARVEALREEQDDYNEFVEEQIEKEERVLEAFIERLEKEQEAFEETKRAEITLLNEQYNAQIRLLDAEAQEKIQKLNDEIERIREQAAEEREIARLKKQEQEQLDLELAVSQAETREQKQEAEAELEEFLAELERERIEKERENRIQGLEEKIENIEQETEQKKLNVEKQFETEKARLEDEILAKRTTVENAIIARKKETENVITQLNKEKEAYNEMVDDKIESINRGSRYYQEKLQEDFEEFKKVNEQEIKDLEELHDKIEEQPDLIDTSRFDQQLLDVQEFYNDLIKETEEAIDDLEDAIERKEDAEDKASKRAVERSDVTKAGSGMMGGLQGNVTGNRATGGAVRAGEMYRVGEVEEELFIPNQDGRIYNQRQIAGMGGITVNINNPKVFDTRDVDKMGDAFVKSLRRKGLKPNG